MFKVPKFFSPIGGLPEKLEKKKTNSTKRNKINGSFVLLSESKVASKNMTLATMLKKNFHQWVAYLKKE